MRYMKVSRAIFPDSRERAAGFLIAREVFHRSHDD